MAKRKKKKKINPRVLAVVAALAVLFVIAVAGFAIKRMGQDPIKLATEAEAHFKRAQTLFDQAKYREAYGQFNQARRKFSQAYGNSDQDANYLYRQAEVDLKMLQDPTMSGPQRIQFIREYQGLLVKASTSTPPHAEATRELAELHFTRGMTNLETNVSFATASLNSFLRVAERLMSIEGESASLLNRMGIAYGELARLDSTNREWAEKALPAFRKAIELEPDKPEYRQSMIRYLRRTGQDELAEEEYQTAIAELPDSAILRINYADFLRNQGKPEQALQIVQKLTEDMPDEADGYIALALHYKESGQRDKAYEAVNKAVEVDENSYRARARLAQLYEEDREYEKAKEQLRKGIEIARATVDDDTKDDLQKNRSRQARVLLHRILAMLLLKQADDIEDPQAREELIQEAEVSEEALASLAPDSSQYALVSGSLHFIRDEYAEAVEPLEAAVQAPGGLDSDSATMLYKTYMLLDQPGKAETLLEKILAEPGQGTNPSLLLAHAELQISRGAIAEAYQNVSAALNARPDDPKGNSLKSLLQVLTGEKDTLDDTAIISRQQAAMLAQRAERLWDQNQRSRAIQVAESALRVRPNNETLVSRLVGWYRDTGQGNKAQSLLQAVRRADPEKAEQAAFEAAVAQAPDNETRLQMRFKRAEQLTEDPLEENIVKARVALQYNYLDRAEAFIEAAREIDPENPDVVRVGFQHALQSNDIEQARKMVELGRKLNIDNANGNELEARFLMMQKNFSDAVEVLRAGLDEQPYNKVLRVLLGNSYLAMQNPEDAEQAFREVLRGDRNYLDAMIGMARVHGMKENTEEANLWIERAYNTPRGPTVDMIADEYMKILQSRGNPDDYPEIIRYREEQFRADPRDLPNAYRLGTLYERTGQNERAEKIYRHLFENGGNDINYVKPLLRFYSKTGQRSALMLAFSELDKRIENKVTVRLALADALSRSDPAQAETAYKNAVEAEPDNVQARRGLASFYAEQGQLNKAIEQLKAYLQSNPDDDDVRRTLIEYQIQSREEAQLAEARQSLDRMLQNSPDDVEAHTLMGMLAFNEGFLEDSLDHLNRALDIQPNYSKALLGRANVYQTRGELREARNDLAVLREQANNTQITLRFAELCQALDEEAQAEVAFLEGLEQSPGNPDLLRGLMQLYVRLDRWDRLEEQMRTSRGAVSDYSWFWLLRARLAQVNKNLDIYQQALDTAVRVAPASERPMILRSVLVGLLDERLSEKALDLVNEFAGQSGVGAWTDGIKGHAMYIEGNAQQALLLFQDAIKKGRMEDKLFVLNEMRKVLGDRQALDQLRLWAQTDLKEDPGVNLMIGEMLAMGSPDDIEEAIPFIQKALELTDDPEFKGSAYSALGIQYQRIEKLQQAREAYEKSLEFRPDDLRVLNNLAYLYADQLGEPETALPYARRAYEQAPQLPAVVDTYGWTLALLGRNEEASRYLSQAVGLAPNDPDYRYHLGMIYKNLNEIDRAERQFREARKLAQETNQGDMQLKAQQALESL